MNTVGNGILPGPGEAQLFNYSQYYDADAFMAENGSRLLPNFRSHIAVDAPRVIYTYPFDLGGNFHLASGIVGSLIHGSVTINGSHKTFTGVGDTISEPLFITWNNNRHNLIIYGGTDVWAPTGRYRRNALDNTGLNYWTFGPAIFVTWFPSRALEISTGVVSEFNTTNLATDYRSGSSVTIDQAVIVRPFNSVPKLRAGLQGFWHQQISDDRMNGTSVGNGFRGRAFGLGPQISYDAFRNDGILIKYQRELGVENRLEGDRFWFKLAVPITSRHR